MIGSLVKITASTLVAGFAYSLTEPYRLVVREFEVPMPNLPPEVEGLKIVQLSDLHASAISSFNFLRQAIEVCNRLQPHVVALTGDYVSRRDSYSQFTGARIWARPVMYYAERVAQVLSDLKAPDGIFAVPGNHDHSRGNCGAIMDLLEKSGIAALVDKSTRVRGVLPLIGFDDLRGGRPELRKVLRDIPGDAAQIILSHNPRLLLSVANRNALMLAGHTHAGQVHLPVVPIRLKPSDVVSTPHLGGWYRQGQAWLYVNNGLGSVHFPMRFRCPPEISVFTLRSL